MYLHLFANPFLPFTIPITADLQSALVPVPTSFFSKSMDAVSPDEPNQDVHGTAKRLLEGEGTALPESKRAKVDENPGIGPDKGPYVSDTAQKSHKGKQNEKNKGRRRGTRPQAEDRPKTPRLPKRQCAILIGFSGTNYAGMQM